MIPARDIEPGRRDRRRRLVAGPALALLFGLAACAHDQHRLAEIPGLPGRTIAVSCTMQAQAGAPCHAEAQRACGSDAQLAGIISAVEIPMPVGPDQRGRSSWRYQARYRCS